MARWIAHSGSHAPTWEHVRALRVRRQDRTRSARPAFPRGAWEREAAPSSQSRVAKMEAGDASISLDPLIR